MTKNQQAIGSILGLIIGIIGGVAGTAYAMGADKQRVNDTLAAHALTMVTLRNENVDNKEAIQKELDRFVEIIASPITLLQSSIIKLTDDIADLRTDVQVLKALMERMEIDRRTSG